MNGLAYWLLIGCIGCSPGSFKAVVPSEAECKRIAEIYSGTYDGVRHFFSVCKPTAEIFRPQDLLALGPCAVSVRIDENTYSTLAIPWCPR